MNKLLFSSTLLPIVLAIFISILFIPSILYYQDSDSSIVLINTLPSSNGFYWPTPGFNNITSKFGYRIAPTSGASTYHGGIDIGAKEGSKIYAIDSGVVTKASWGGANGYMVTISHQNGYSSTYAHVNPNFIVKVGDSVSKGQYIANVGPKYVNETSYTTIKDSSGRATNGATTGPHLHLAISKGGKRINPETLF